MSNAKELSDDKIKKLLASLTKVNDELDNIVSDIATSADTSNIFWSQINTRIRKSYEIARRITKEWTNSSMSDVYSEQVRAEIMKIKNKKLPAPKKIDYSSFSSTHSFKQAYAALLEDTLSTFATGFLSGERTLRKLASLTQQVNLSEKEIEKSITEGFIEKGSVQGSTKKLQKKLLKKAIDGKYITVVDKNGKERQYNLKKYSKMVAKTKLHEAMTQGTITTAAAVGADLIQISAHNTTTAYDAQFEGKIYSLSGSDKDFPPVEDLPPFHPNCRHTTSIVFKEALEQNGTLQEYIDFSNDEQGEHPTRQSFIPLSEREFVA